MRRRLLADYVSVDATLNMPDAAAAGRAAAALTAGSIGAELARAGLPPATVTKAAAVALVAAGMAAAAAPSLLVLLAAAVAGAAAAAAALLAAQ